MTEREYKLFALLYEQLQKKYDENISSMIEQRVGEDISDLSDRYKGEIAKECMSDFVEETGKTDKNGDKVYTGDVFEFDDVLLIICDDKVRVFQNQVEWDAELPPIYYEIEPLDIDDLQFEYAEKIGTVFNNDEYMELFLRPEEIHIFRDEYDED